MKTLLRCMCKKDFSLIDCMWIGIFGSIPAIASFGFITATVWLICSCIIMPIVMTYIQEKLVTYCNS
jgi:hypothetical protein